MGAGFMIVSALLQPFTWAALGLAGLLWQVFFVAAWGGAASLWLDFAGNACSRVLGLAPLSLGDDASTGAGSVVNKDVPAGARVVGHPARTASRRSSRRSSRDESGGGS